MFNEPSIPVVQKRMSFFSIGAICLTSVLIVTILSVSAIGVYGLRIADRKADGLVDVVGKLAQQLPELRDSLPPALFDAIDDERRPDYLGNLKVTVKRAADGRSREHYCRAVVEVENKGDQTVSLLTMRIVGLDENGEPVSERKTWAASPLQLDDDWRGPILPKETRRFTVRYFDADETTSFSHEITEVRLWCGYDRAEDSENKGLMAMNKKLGKTVKSD